jgi:predicted Zn-dependent protease
MKANLNKRLLVVVLFALLVAGMAAEARRARSGNSAGNEGDQQSLPPMTPEQSQRERQAYEITTRAIKLLDEQKYVEARGLLLQAAAFDPSRNSGNLHSMLGFTNQKLGNLMGAVEEYQKAIEFQPKLVDLTWNIGVAYKDLGDYNQAREWINRYLSIGSPTRERRQAAEGMLKKISEQSDLNGGVVSSTDYLQSLLSQKGAARWPREQFPLKVFIQKPDKVFGVPEDSDNLLLNSFEAWNTATGKRMPIQVVDDRKIASITVRWTEHPSEVKTKDNVHIEQGVTLVRAYTLENVDVGVIKHADITLLTVSRDSGKPLSTDKMRSVCLHEIGHALGLLGHSPNSADTMYFSNSARQLPSLSRRDKCTMAKLYGAPPPYPQAQPNIQAGFSGTPGLASPPYPGQAAPPAPYTGTSDQPTIQASSPSYQNNNAGYDASQNSSYQSSNAGYNTSQSSSYRGGNAGYDASQSPSYQRGNGGYNPAHAPSYQGSNAGYNASQSPSYHGGNGGYNPAQTPSYQGSNAGYNASQNYSYQGGNGSFNPAQAPSYQGGNAGYNAAQNNSYQGGNAGHNPAQGTSYQGSNAGHGSVPEPSPDPYQGSNAGYTRFQNRSAPGGNPPSFQSDVPQYKPFPTDSKGVPLNPYYPPGAQNMQHGQSSSGPQSKANPGAKQNQGLKQNTAVKQNPGVKPNPDQHNQKGR